MEIKVINKSENQLPKYETESSAGMDIRANLPDGSVKLMPLGRTIIPTGLFMELPDNTFGMITPRSGLAAKHGISIVNSPGVIDSSYRGEVKIILVNLSNELFVVNDGDRIAQFLLMSYENGEFKEVDVLSETERGEGGFGHTGVK